MRIKNISETDKREIRNHLETTADTMIKAYTQSQLALMDWKPIESIKHWWAYIPVRIDWSYNLWKYKNNPNRKPYQIRYVRVDEIKALYGKRNKGRKKLIEETN